MKRSVQWIDVSCNSYRNAATDAWMDFDAVGFANDAIVYVLRVHADGREKLQGTILLKGTG
ncbi:MAG: hypothetical protein ACLP9S_00620 [Syntrophales bacterium]